MSRSHTLAVAFLFALCACWAQSPASGQQTQEVLARGLASSSRADRIAASEAAVATPSETLLLFRKWERNVPFGVAGEQLYLSMIEVYGRLKAEDGIPFLIDHISWTEASTGGMWLKKPEIVASRLPAVHALLQIGRPATSPLINAYYKTAGEDRWAIVLTLVLMKDPKARETLVEINRQASILLIMSEAALTRFDENKTERTKPLRQGTKPARTPPGTGQHPIPTAASAP